MKSWDHKDKPRTNSKDKEMTIRNKPFYTKSHKEIEMYYRKSRKSYKIYQLHFNNRLRSFCQR